MIGEEEFKAWLQDPVTRAVRERFSAKREQLRREWEQSEPGAYAAPELILANVGNIGWCRGLAYAETYDYETYVMEIEDGEQVGVGPARSGGVDKAV